MQASSLKYSGYQIGYFVWGKMPQSPTYHCIHVPLKHTVLLCTIALAWLWHNALSSNHTRTDMTDTPNKLIHLPLPFRQGYTLCATVHDMSKPPISSLYIQHISLVYPSITSCILKTFTCNIHAAWLIIYISFLLLGGTVVGVLAGLIYFPDYVGPKVFTMLWVLYRSKGI